MYRYGYEGNNQDFDLVVFNGDVFNNTNSETQIKDHLRMYARRKFIKGAAVTGTMAAASTFSAPHFSSRETASLNKVWHVCFI